MTPARRTVMIHPEAPPKPPTGQPCNGCGLCCLYAPCPTGIVVTRRSTGACRALTWDEERRLYRCGLLHEPRRHVPWLPAAWTRRLAARWISAGSGCDADLQHD